MWCCCETPMLPERCRAMNVSLLFTHDPSHSWLQIGMIPYLHRASCLMLRFTNCRTDIKPAARLEECKTEFNRLFLAIQKWLNFEVFTEQVDSIFLIYSVEYTYHSIAYNRSLYKIRSNRFYTMCKHREINIQKREMHEFKCVA